jgi:mono/diheme cytochrome c family protein
VIRRTFPASAAAAIRLGLMFGAAAVAFSSCQKSGQPPAPSATTPASGTSGAATAAQPADLAARGRVIYQAHCTSCHNSDPHKAGSLGPELWGSSLELIQSRVMKAEYPTGYAPKRATHIMQPLPQLSAEIPALRAYLNSKE